MYPKTRAQHLLDTAAIIIKSNPEANVKVISYGAFSKMSQQLSYDRTNAVIKYLNEKTGIIESRLIFNYGLSSGNCNQVDLIMTLETGPNALPAPHPNLRAKQ